MDAMLLEKYAEFAVKIGANPQEGQTLIINAPIEGAEFARACAEVAYTQTKVREVVLFYNDEKFSRIRMEHTALDVLEDIKPWQVRRSLDYLESQGGGCFLHIIGEDPEIYKGLDGEKVDKAGQARSRAMEPIRAYTMTDKVQWSIVAMPTVPWAKAVFPNETPEQAVELLWQAIFDVCRVTGGDPVSAWQAHTAQSVAMRDKLNQLNLDSVHMKSRNGTDVTIGLAQGAIWEGAQSTTPEGYTFIANIPTEELFTAPDKDRVDGVVMGTKPYVYNGNLIEDFSVTFQGGKVVSHDAKKGKELLGQLLDTDEGSRRIGELALVPVTSPINLKNLLFYNTLFDENAACHIAFGKGYPTTIVGGATMTKEELLEKGVNHSIIHEDVMIGSEDMDITGTTKDGKVVQIFRNGQWAL